MSKRIPEVEYMCQHCRRSDAEDYLHRYTIDYINKVNPYVFNIPNEYEDGDLDEIFIYLIHTQTGQDLMKKFQSIIIHGDIIKILDPFIKNIFAPSFVNSKTNIEALQYIKEHNPTQIQQYLAKFKYCEYMLCLCEGIYQWINTIFYGFEIKKEFFKIVGKDLLCGDSLCEGSLGRSLNFTYCNKTFSAEKIKLLKPFYTEQDLEFYSIQPKIKIQHKCPTNYEHGRLLIYSENVYSKLKKYLLSFKDNSVGKYYKQEDIDVSESLIKKCICCGESTNLNNVFKYTCCNVRQCMICLFKKINEFDKKYPAHIYINDILTCPYCQQPQKYIKVFNIIERSTPSTPSPSFDESQSVMSVQRSVQMSVQIPIQMSEFERCPSILDSNVSGYFDSSDSE